MFASRCLTPSHRGTASKSSGTHRTANGRWYSTNAGITRRDLVGRTNPSYVVSDDDDDEPFLESPYQPAWVPSNQWITLIEYDGEQYVMAEMGFLPRKVVDTPDVEGYVETVDDPQEEDSAETTSAPLVGGRVIGNVSPEEEYQIFQALDEHYGSGKIYTAIMFTLFTTAVVGQLAQATLTDEGIYWVLAALTISVYSKVTGKG